MSSMFTPLRRRWEVFPVSERHTPLGSTRFPVAHFQRPSEGRSLFASLIDVLNRSRRRQAERILRQHRQLIANSDQCATFGQSLDMDHDSARH